MTHYIFTRSKGFNEVIEATIEKPKEDIFTDIVGWAQYCLNLESTAKRYTIEGEIPDNWNEGEEVEIRLQAQAFAGFVEGEWINLADCELWYAQNKKSGNKKLRIVAIPIHTDKCPAHVETQDELWNELLGKIVLVDRSFPLYWEQKVKSLSNQYTITRKLKNNEHK